MNGAMVRPVRESDLVEHPKARQPHRKFAVKNAKDIEFSGRQLRIDSDEGSKGPFQLCK